MARAPGKGARAGRGPRPARAYARAECSGRTLRRASDLKQEQTIRRQVVVAAGQCIHATPPEKGRAHATSATDGPADYWGGGVRNAISTHRPRAAKARRTTKTSEVSWAMRRSLEGCVLGSSFGRFLRLVVPVSRMGVRGCRTVAVVRTENGSARI